MESRPSQRSANVAYYRRNRQAEIGRVRRRQDRNLALLRELRKVGCVDCGAVLASHQMDFDHRDPSVKSFGLTTARALGASVSRLLEEVAKCDVVCAVCHRLRTRDQHRRRLRGPARRAGMSPGIERKRRNWRSQARLLDALRDVPCADCGGRFPPCAMDFDHRDPASKTAGVTRLVGRVGTARLLAEAGKCDIVCANCHRARTHVARELQV